MQTDERNYVEGMDMDTDERLLPVGFYPYGKNGRSGTSDQNFKNSVECIRGNKLHNYNFPDGTGTYKCIGFAEDIQGLSIIYFIWNDQGNFHILRYFLKTGVITDVIPTTWTNLDLLGFTQFDKIWNARVVYNGTNEYLIWTDAVTSIKCINLDLANKYPTTTALDTQLITLAKQPPQLPPTVSLITNTGSVSFIGGKGFQFRYKYVYDDDSSSIWSPISDVVIAGYFDTAIHIAFIVGYQTVKETWIAAREGNGVSDGSTNPEWYVIKKIPFDSSFIHTYDFTNTELKEIISRLDSDKLFESIPDVAGAMELTDTNQIVVGDIVEGEDNPVIGNEIFTGIVITNQYDTGSLNLINAMAALVQDQVSPLLDHTDPYDILLQTPLILRYGVIIDDYQYDYYKTFQEGLDFATAHVEFTVVYTSGRVNDTTEVKLLQNGTQISPDSSDTAYVFTFVGESHTFSFDVDVKLAQNDVFSINIANITNTSFTGTIYTINAGGSLIEFNLYDKPRVGFKENTTAEVGIVYFDQYLKSGGLIPLVTEPFNKIEDKPGLEVKQSSIYSPWLKVEIYNRPPDWAYYYAICLKETEVEYGWFVCPTNTVTSGKTVLTYNSLPRGFEPVKGDYVRMIGNYLTSAAYVGTYNIYPAGTYTELLVDSVDLNAKTITVNGNLDLDTNFTNIVEVYRIANKSKFYFENQVNPILNPTTAGRNHGSPIQNQDWANDIPAELDVFGDTYMRYNNGYIVYTPYYNEAFASNYWNKGRPEIVVENMARIRFQNYLRWGGALFPNTQVNNLPVWDSGNFKLVDQKNGAITGLRQRGYTLKIIQEKNINSAPIGRKEINNADGSTQLVITDNLIGVINPSEKRFGSVHKGSIVLYDDDLYYFDQINGKFIRDSMNGQLPISDNGAQKYFRDLAELCIQFGVSADVICGKDIITKQLYVSFVEHSDAFTTYSKTISFFYPKNQWKFFYDFAVTVGENQKPIEMYGWCGQQGFMMLDGQLWQSNILTDVDGNPVYLKLFGEDRDWIITGVTNQDQIKVKIMLTHSIHANRTPDEVLLNIMKSTMYPLGMESELKSANYALREGVYYAAIKRDAFTLGTPADSTARRIAIAGGRAMRGNSMIYKMTWTGNDYAVLLASAIGWNPSEKS